MRVNVHEWILIRSCHVYSFQCVIRDSQFTALPTTYQGMHQYAETSNLAVLIRHNRLLQDKYPGRTPKVPDKTPIAR